MIMFWAPSVKEGLLIVVTLIRWMEKLTRLGRVSETSLLVGKVTARAPALGCNRLESLPANLAGSEVRPISA